MRRELKKRAFIVCCSSASEFEKELNEKFDAIGGKVVDIKFNMGSSEGHCAYILYDEEVSTPESAKDRWFMDGGEQYVCGECPYFVPPSDKRLKKGFCNHMQDWAVARESACTWLYRELVKGEMEL